MRTLRFARAESRGRWRDEREGGEWIVGVSCEFMLAAMSQEGQERGGIVRKRKYDPITATICGQLHWLPVRQRIKYKLEIIEYRWRDNSHLAELCFTVDSNPNRRHLRSTAHGASTVPRTKTDTDHAALGCLARRCGPLYVTFHQRFLWLVAG